MAGGVARAPRRARARGASLERLILDTTVLVAAERGSAVIEEVVGDEDDVAIAAVTAAELMVGVELADRRRSRRRRAFVTALLESLPVEPYDLEVARAHAVLLGHTRRSGRARGAHDLIIAATGVARGRTVVTADSPGFEALPGLSIRVLPSTL